jgi:hypothetical protein
LQDEQNYKVQPDTFNLWANGLRAMELSQRNTSGEKNALLIAINDNLEDATGL